MTRGIEAAAAGMVSVVNWNDIIANNLANINTPGFKQTLVSFKDIKELDANQIDAAKGYNKTKIGNLSAGSLLDSTVFDFKQGSIKQTGNPLDLAINGDGFFVVKTPEGEAYTRNGSFIRRDDGIITTVDGYQLIGESGNPINFNINNTKGQEIKIGKDGTVLIGKEIMDKLKIVDFTDKKNLEAQGNSLFKPANNEAPIKAAGFEVNQGSLEMANSNAIESMVNSIHGMRTYETLAKVIETDNRTLSKTVNEVGRIKR